MLQITTEWENEVDIEITEDDDCDNPDPYDHVYSNIPKSTHILKTEENCRFCGAKKFQYESIGLCCNKGNINWPTQRRHKYSGDFGQATNLMQDIFGKI